MQQPCYVSSHKAVSASFLATKATLHGLRNFAAGQGVCCYVAIRDTAEVRTDALPIDVSPGGRQIFANRHCQSRAVFQLIDALYEALAICPEGHSSQSSAGCEYSSEGMLKSRYERNDSIIQLLSAF